MQDLIIAIIGLIGIVISADYFIDQSTALAKRLKISSYVIGFTIVAFGTSLPELVISLYSALTGHTSIVISNVIGSNIANICLVIGVMAIINPYKLTVQDVFYNIPLNLLSLIVFMVVAMLNKGIIATYSSLILLTVFTISIFLSKHNNHKTSVTTGIDFSLIKFVISLSAIIFFGKLTVDYILKFSLHFGIEETILGYFIIAIGTSLPELIASITAIKKGNLEIGIGNILGSNVFNLLFILGTSSMILPLNLNSFLLDIFILFVITALLVALAFIGRKYYFSKIEGVILLLLYGIFISTRLWI